MALREEQILRYSRQILLREVGGRGQEALLAGGVTLHATGAAGLTAGAYLAAAGTGVRGTEALLGAEAPGFLSSAGEVGSPAALVLARSVPELNPDAAPARGDGLLAELPAAWHGEGPWVALGGEGARGAVVYRGPDGCAGCFEETVRPLGPPPPGALGVGLGALGALVLQRLLLGLERGLGGRWLAAPGVLEDLPPTRCARCR